MPKTKSIFALRVKKTGNLLGVNCQGAMGPRMSFPADRARLVAQAMLVCADELDAANS